MKKSDQDKLTELLSRLKPGFLPYPIFKQMARIMVMPIIEVVPLRINGAMVEVLFIERPEEDDIWPGELHTPGTVIRATDLNGSIHGAFKRIFEDELGGLKTSDPYFVGTLFQTGKRGAEQSQIYWVEVLEEPTVGKYYAVNNLPDNIVEQQIKFIKQSVESFKKAKKLQIEK